MIARSSVRTTRSRIRPQEVTHKYYKTAECGIGNVRDSRRELKQYCQDYVCSLVAANAYWMESHRSYVRSKAGSLLWRSGLVRRAQQKYRYAETGSRGERIVRALQTNGSRRLVGVSVES